MKYRHYHHHHRHARLCSTVCPPLVSPWPGCGFDGREIWGWAFPSFPILPTPLPSVALHPRGVWLFATDCVKDDDPLVPIPVRG